MSGSDAELSDAVIGSRVREARTRLQLTQAGLAQRLAAEGLTLHSSAIAKIESGERSLRLVEGPALSRALGVSLAWLAGQTDEAPPRAVDGAAELALRRILRIAEMALPEGRVATLERAHANLAKLLVAGGVTDPEALTTSLASIKQRIDELRAELPESD